MQWLRFGSIVTIKSKLHGQNQLCQAEVQATSPQQGKHLDVGEWLKALELQQYEKLFDKFEGVEDLLDHSEADIKSLGVKISSHRAKIMTSLTGLRCKYYGELRCPVPTSRGLGVVILLFVGIFICGFITCNLGWMMNAVFGNRFPKKKKLQRAR